MTSSSRFSFRRADGPGDAQPENRPGRPGGVSIRVRGLTKRYGAVPAVSDLDLDIAGGEFFSLLGPSGCGKTTTLRLLGGFEEPTSGTILFGEEDVTTRPPYYRDVNTVFQNYALFPRLSVFDNVAFGLRRRHVDAPEIRRRVHEALELVGLSDLAQRRPAQLSGGQQQRTALARALVNEPQLLLLDEPMGALDAKLRKHMQQELKSIQQRTGITFLYVTHDQEEAMSMSDRLAVMQHGQVEGIGTPEEVYDNPATEFVAEFLGASNLLDAQVQETAAANAVVTLADGTALRVPAARIPGGQPPTVKIGVRPEKIHLLPPEHETDRSLNVIRGTIAFASYVGVSHQYRVERADGSVIVVYVQNQGALPAPAIGDSVQLAWIPAQTFVIRGGDSSPDPERPPASRPAAPATSQ
jgi:spermidine/putrescine transport system ATP-binding protein